MRVPVRFALLLPAAALAFAGCRSAPRPVGAGYVPVLGAAAPHPRADDTFVYVVNGADPLHLAGVRQLADRLRARGYPHTRFGEWYEVGGFEREIREVHRQNPAARFALVGYSAGAYAVRGTANRLVRDGVPVALVGYVGGDYLTDTEETRVPGAGRVVNVTGNGYLPTGRNLFFNGTDVTGAANLRLRAEHLELPRHLETADLLLGELAAIPAD